ncbi:MAG: glyoxalase/bleomycin resistance/extradiol dioxygenase family protein [Taibaiella sp.]|nr:glyoxalase/bleomycin resistance/extradiol dioxygenase family protein [Taibaiella sp.]
MNAYLNFNGNSEEAMNFYKNATEGTIETIQHFGDSPMEVAEDMKSRVLHGIMKIQGSTLMFSDTMSNDPVTFGNNFSLALDFKDDGDINRTFNALSTGGKVTMPLQDTFWGAKFGMCTDKFGVNWMFNMDKPK